MKILNLYAGIGGNRKLWGDDHEIVAVESDERIAQIYSDLFPKDKLIITDAHVYLANHFDEYDFIWTSPPCQSHSSFRQNIGVRFRGTKPTYPDLKLYEEIIFLQYNAKTKWVVENVKPYYRPLIKPSHVLQRHYFWSNFPIRPIDVPKDKIRTAQIPDLELAHGYDLSSYKISNKRQILRNCVAPMLGKHILDELLV